MECKKSGCTNVKIKDTATQTHRYCVACRDALYQAALTTCRGIKETVVAMRNEAYGKGSRWVSINAGENRGFQTTIGGTDNPLRVEPEAWYKFIKGNSAHISLSGVLSKHYTCKYGGDTIIVHVSKK